MDLLRRFNRIAAFLSCLALFGASGGHWVVLQSVAWTEMWVRYAHTETVTQAAVKTFDGKHPCAMCKRIIRAKSKDQKPDWTISFQKFSITKPEATNLVMRPFWKDLRFGLEGRIFHSRSRLAPPTPPPQFGFIA